VVAWFVDGGSMAGRYQVASEEGATDELLLWKVRFWGK
jgi:hypothetical protein